MEQKKKLDTRTFSLMKRLVKESVGPYKMQVFLALVFMLVSSVAASMSMFILKPVFDDIFTNKNEEMLWTIGVAIIFIYLVKSIAYYGQAASMSWLGLRIVTDLQVKMYDHFMRMDLNFFHANPSGTLVARITNDTVLMRNTATKVLTSAGKDLTLLIGMVIVMLTTNWQLALLALVVFPITIGPVLKLGRRIRKVTVNTQTEIGLLITLLGQTLSGIRHVKAYRMEKYEQGRVRGITENIRALVFKAERTKALNSPIMETVAGFAVAVVIVYGGYQVIEGVKTTGDFMAFLGSALMCYEPAKRLANLNSEMQGGLAGAERMYTIRDIEPSIQAALDAPDLQVKQGGILFKDIEFSYEEDKPALHQFTLDIPAGKTVALVGPSGAGKSTVLNLVPRFYDVNDGSVLIDGQNIRDVNLTSLRKACALVSQEIVLFDDTIRANIAYGRFEASEEEIIEAAKHAAAHEFIMELPEGYDTIVGEDGVKLSGGQRQRVSIARAMLKNAPILLLDEATSALDTQSERKVQAALTELMKERTTLVIAHRLSTVVDADLIYVIDQGRVAEQGTHAQLIDHDGIYAKLYAMQFSDDESVENA
ncbi:Lipid A export ATP-binding/permease protein MsbA [Candidatus Terasakiella magnetica]|uniref:Lipid A export ATP-binding/permease protein MsbA n=1 Tax=Candidatus Terasakiella magnetica TaxID=1867952 RepID=A0A1C3RF23_9PROT|nr:ABC transporter transmembrane domain-containing protein [Candidatus Terasakiella magnetica]SCA55858.1 Lipid A export ATP-binding/permease protein MsbA [Candidatus Terasakiella magnetica]